MPSPYRSVSDPPLIGAGGYEGGSDRKQVERPCGARGAALLGLATGHVRPLGGRVASVDRSFGGAVARDVACLCQRSHGTLTRLARPLLRPFPRHLRGRLHLGQGEFGGRERCLHGSVDLRPRLVGVAGEHAVLLALALGPAIEQEPDHSACGRPARRLLRQIAGGLVAAVGGRIAAEIGHTRTDAAADQREEYEPLHAEAGTPRSVSAYETEPVEPVLTDGGSGGGAAGSRLARDLVARDEGG